MATHTKFRSGKRGVARVGSPGLTLALTEWSTTVRGADLNVNNFESNGFDEGLIGFIGVDWSLRGNWDATQPPYTDPPGLFPRDNGVLMELLTNTTDNFGVIMPAWRCLNSRATCNAEGLVTIEADGKSQGEFTMGQPTLTQQTKEPPSAARPTTPG